MFARKGRRWFRRTLAQVDPSAFAESLESYLGALPFEEVRALALRCTAELPESERLQFALYVDEKCLNGSDDLLARRMTAFFRQNPQTAWVLGTEALESIFSPLRPEAAHLEHRRVTPAAAGLAVLALLVAVTPLAAQYMHQRGMLAGLRDASVAPPVIAALPRPMLANAVHIAAAGNSHDRPHARKTNPGRAARPRQTRRLAMHPATPQPQTGPAHAVRTRPTAKRLAWFRKFDPQDYRYFNHPTHFQTRARLAVQSYLNAIIAGDTRSALAHLGLPPDANLVNLSEVPIISRRSSARVVSVKPRADGRTQVDADIHGKRGEYFEVFYVAADGPALRITDHYYIPVGNR